MIEIYGMEGCVRCEIIKKKLNEKCIEYFYTTQREEVLKVANKFKTRELPICIVEGEHYSYVKMVQWVNGYEEEDNGIL